jgi:prepilin-type N-terminal cleavage/methylation domain-containing protein
MMNRLQLIVLKRKVPTRFHRRGTPVFRTKRGIRRGLTLIEMLVVIVIIVLIAGAFIIGFGQVLGARTQSGAQQLAATVRGAHALASSCNKTYALFINLDKNTYRVASVPPGGECDRLLLNREGSGDDPVIIRKREEGKTDDSDSEEPDTMSVLLSLAGSPPPKKSASSSKSSGAGGGQSKLYSMLGSDIRGQAQEMSEKAGFGTSDKTPTSDTKSTKSETCRAERYTQLYKEKKLPKDVSFSQVVVRANGDPVTEGVVPILFYPHGVIQRALIYIEGGSDSDEKYTVELMSYMGLARVHPEALPQSSFLEEIE